MASETARTYPLHAHLETSTGAPDGHAEARRHPRRALRLDTSGELEDGSRANVTLHNISAAGLLIESDVDIAVGEVLTLILPEHGPVGAEIVWQSGRLFGCAFEQALGEAALAAAQLRGGNALGAGSQQTDIGARPAAQAKPLGGGIAMPLGGKLNRLRREKGLTLAQIAEALGVSKPTVWAWEKGKARPLPERIDAIAEILGVTRADLTEDEAGSSGGALVAECRNKLADAYGVAPGSVRIMIEV